MDCCLIVDRHHGLEERALKWSLGPGLGVPIFQDIIFVTRDKPLTFQASASFVKEMQAGGMPLGLMPTYLHACMLGCFSHVQLFVTSWTVAHQAPLSGILQARILEWVAVPSSKGSSQTQGSNQRRLHGRQILYPSSTREAPPPYLREDRELYTWYLSKDTTN